jgi:alpha-amylase/alpha-mannosidase (GH57 family)
MTQVAFLWHMHQPYYEDLVTREHILPWVRMHGLKDYYGMVALLREFPAIRMTFNLVPSLLVQLEAFAGNRAHDRYLEVGLKSAAELSEEDASFIVRNFFHAQRQRMIDIHPRYAELASRRGAIATIGDVQTAARRFSVDDLRDLQVWQKLAWIDPIYIEQDERVRALVAKDRGFTEDDKILLRAIELELLNAVIPAYRDATARGQVELSTSPFYHPILPLLCDTEVYKRTHPDSKSPRHRFIHPEDAKEQLERAVLCHQRLFGSRPVGLWPSEGSVSDAMVPLVEQAGFAWMATDELILARTLGIVFNRDASGQVDQPDRLYKPYVVQVGGARVACAFRDHTLSDLIGFTYAGWAAEAAAEDFVARLSEAGRRYSAKAGGAEAVVPIILDGENAWEHFERGGRPFLRALYKRLSASQDLRTVTMGEACRRAGGELAGIFPGSWIDANFYIWIGHRDDRLAWSQLAEAREAIETPNGDQAAAARAREEVLIAEGSDWFWWYGDDHSSEHDLEFDDLFRRHLRNVYRLLEKPIPDELFVSNISGAAAAPAESTPAGLLTPTLDGEETSYFEWLGAGLLEVRDTAGAMHRSDRRPSVITLVQFGFDREHLYVRLDGFRPVIDLLADGFEFSLKFLNPEGLRFSVRQRFGRLTGVLWDWRAAGPHWKERGPGGAVVAAGTILEVAVPIADLWPATDRSGPSAPVAFFIAVYDRDDAEIERHPPHRPIEAELPDARFEARNWTA